MTEQGIGADRHYSVLFGGDNNTMRIRIACGSEADVAVSQILGVFVRELEDGRANWPDCRICWRKSSRWETAP